MFRQISLLLLVLLSFTASASAQIREWKSGDGSVRGQYIGVDGISVIIVNSQGEQQKLSYFLQSSQNQAFIREQLRRKDDLDSLPKAGEERNWTQNNGDTFAGRFAGADQSYIYILANGNVQAVEKSKLSRSDVEYAERVLRDPAASGVPSLGSGSTTPEPESTEPPKEPENENKPSSTDFFSPSNTEPTDDGNSRPENTNNDGNSTPVNAASTDQASNRTAREQSRRKAMASVASQRPFYVPPSNNVTAFGQAEGAAAGAVVSYAAAGGGLSFIQIVAIILTIAAIAAVGMQYAGQRKTN